MTRFIGVEYSPMNEVSPTEVGLTCSSVANGAAKRYSFHAAKKASTAAAATDGLSTGKTTNRSTASLGQPSTRAASSISGGTASTAPLIIQETIGTTNAALTIT